MLSLELLGTPIVRLNGQDITARLRHSSQCLLFYLALNPRPQSRAALAQLLWPRLSTAYGYGNLRESLHHLRKVVGDHMHVDRRALALKPSECQVDVAALRELPDLCAGEAPITDIEAHLVIYRGDFLMDWRMPDSPAYNAWVTARRQEFQRLALSGLAALAERGLAAGDPTASLRATQRGLDLRPQDEVMMRLRMLALAHSGQRLSALEAFEHFRQTLSERFKVTPAPDLEALAQQLRQGDPLPGSPPSALMTTPAPAPAATAPASKPTPIPGNLPRSLNPFFGRQAELDQLRSWLSQPNYGLITLTGTGGVGKSRLALEAGRAARDLFPDGVWLVPLTYVEAGSGPEQALLQALAAALDLQPSRSALRDQIIGRLQSWHTLLILDGFDSLVKAGTFLVDLLHAAHGVRLLVTSRERLDLQAEQPLLLQGLPVPGPEAQAPETELSPALQLLVERARRASPWFQLTASNRGAAVAICNQLVGLPLGLELAAAQLTTLRVEELARDLQESTLSLQAEQTDLEPHQRGLASNLRLSWQRLSTDQQRALSICSVFQGGFDDVAAAAIGQVCPDDLQALTARSLIAKVDARRFDLHPLIREFAQTHSGETGVNQADLRRQHAIYYADLFTARLVDLTSDPNAGREMAPDRVNLRAAWRELLAARDLERIRKGLYPLFTAFGQQAASQLTPLLRQLDTALRVSVPGESDRERQRSLGVVLGWLSQMVERQGDLETARRLAEEAMALGDATGDEELQASSQLRMAGLYFAQHDLPATRDAAQRGLELARRVDHPRWQCVALSGLALALDELHGDMDEVIALNQEALKQAHRAHERRTAMTIGYNLGDTYMRRGNLYAARQVELEALESARAFGSVPSECWLNHGLGAIEMHFGRLAEARAYLERGLQVAKSMNDLRWQLLTTGTLAALEAQRADYLAMRQYLELAEHVGKPTQYKVLQAGIATQFGHLEMALGQLDAAEDAFRRSEELMPDDQPASELEMVIRLGLRALLRCWQGRLPEAMMLAERALPRLSTLYFQDVSPLFTYRNLWAVLQTARDPRAPALLSEARRRLLGWADQIPDAEFRRSFLEVVLLNREILSGAERLTA